MYQVVAASGLLWAVGDWAGTGVEGGAETVGTDGDADTVGADGTEGTDTVGVGVGLDVGAVVAVAVAFAVGRGCASEVCDGRGDRAGVSDRTGADVFIGTAEDREGEGVRPLVPWSLGRVGCPAVAVEGAARDFVGRGRAVLEVSGSAVRDGSGSSVGRARSLETDGVGRGLPPSDAVSPQIPRPPATRTAAPPTIHGALRGGLRWRLMHPTVSQPAGVLKRWGAAPTARRAFLGSLAVRARAAGARPVAWHPAGGRAALDSRRTALSRAAQRPLLCGVALPRLQPSGSCHPEVGALSVTSVVRSRRRNAFTPAMMS